ncbi:hypothetical protein HK096_000199, partial [Nowakowskiella sp. JEL0078]
MISSQCVKKIDLQIPPDFIIHSCILDSLRICIVGRINSNYRVLVFFFGDIDEIASPLGQSIPPTMNLSHADLSSNISPWGLVDFDDNLNIGIIHLQENLFEDHHPSKMTTKVHSSSKENYSSVDIQKDFKIPEFLETITSCILYVPSFYDAVNPCEKQEYNWWIGTTSEQLIAIRNGKVEYSIDLKGIPRK